MYMFAYGIMRQIVVDKYFNFIADSAFNQVNLNLCDNQLTVLPKSFSRLVNLEVNHLHPAYNIPC